MALSSGRPLGRQAAEGWGSMGEQIPLCSREPSLPGPPARPLSAGRWWEAQDRTWPETLASQNPRSAGDPQEGPPLPARPQRPWEGQQLGPCVGHRRHVPPASIRGSWGDGSPHILCHASRPTGVRCAGSAPGRPHPPSGGFWGPDGAGRLEWHRRPGQAGLGVEGCPSRGLRSWGDGPLRVPTMCLGQARGSPPWGAVLGAGGPLPSTSSPTLGPCSPPLPEGTEPLGLRGTCRLPPPQARLPSAATLRCPLYSPSGADPQPKPQTPNPATPSSLSGSQGGPCRPELQPGSALLSSPSPRPRTPSKGE